MVFFLFLISLHSNKVTRQTFHPFAANWRGFHMVKQNWNNSLLLKNYSKYSKVKNYFIRTFLEFQVDLKYFLLHKSSIFFKVLFSAIPNMVKGRYLRQFSDGKLEKMQRENFLWEEKLGTIFFLPSSSSNYSWFY